VDDISTMTKYNPIYRNGLSFATALLRDRCSIKGPGHGCQWSATRALFFGTGLKKGLVTTSPLSSNPNPGNFANRPRDEVKEIARKGGQKGGKIGGRARGVGGFHDMDPGKQVSTEFLQRSPGISGSSTSPEL
jgi:hypothetical protein